MSSPAKKRAKLDDATTLPSLQTDGTLVNILLEHIELDTVDLLLQISPVCKEWRDAATRYLLRVRAPEFEEEEVGDASSGKLKDDKSDDESVVGDVDEPGDSCDESSIESEDESKADPREDFIEAWKADQEMFWNAHAVAKPTPPSRADVERVTRGARAGTLMPSNHTQACSDYLGGWPYVEVTWPLRDNTWVMPDDNDFDEHDHWLYVRLVRSDSGPDWFGKVPLKSVWRSAASDDTLLLGEQFERYIPEGEALQLRLDIKAVPWTTKDLESMIEEADENKPTCWVVVVAVSKTREDPNVIAYEPGHFKWGDIDTKGEIEIHPDNYFHEATQIQIETTSDGTIERLDAVILATQNNVSDYIEGTELQTWRDEDDY